ncbi:MAG: IS607 family transposase [Chloroflexota bacterium]
MYTIKEFSLKVHIATKTLQKWDRQGKLVAKRTLSNRRYYTDDDVVKVLGVENPPDQRRTIVYCRVSTAGQKRDLQKQKFALEQFCIASGRKVDEWINDIGSGLNFKRKHFVALMSQVEQKEIKEIVIAHQDRLVRFGYEWFELFCTQHGTVITVMNAESLSPEQEMIQDLLAIIRSFSARLSGLSKYKKTLKNIVTNNSHD